MTPQVDVLIITVTKIEGRAVLDVFKKANYEINTVTIEGQYFRDLGCVNNARVYMAITEMGSGGVGGSQHTISKAIDTLKPNAVIMVGIAFGMDETDQNIGDILVSKQLLLYDLQKIKNGDITSRGDKPHATPSLINWISHAELEWNDDNGKVIQGLILSGDKLIDDINYRKQLSKLAPEAIGGEMEGHGLYVSCQNRQTDWILIKAICDFADGNKGEDKDARQKKAAQNAATFVLHALKVTSLRSNIGHEINTDGEVLTSSWFVKQFERQRASLGARYSPSTNIELPIRQDFLAFARDKFLQEQIDCWYFIVNEDGNSAIHALRQLIPANTTTTILDSLSKAIASITSILGSCPISLENTYPLDSLITETKQCYDIAREALNWSYDQPPSTSKEKSLDPKNWARHTLYKLIDSISNIREALESPRWQISNHHAALLVGPAGIGKSHLLADVVESQILEGRPAILILGSTFTDSEPWRQILNQLDRPSTEQIHNFLSKLDAVAEKADVRALICIDALNERNGLDVWPQWLSSFLNIVSSFPRIGIVLSCRTTYVPYVIPDNLGKDILYRLEHEGFAYEGGEAAKAYLDKRGIIRHGAPNLLPEFSNPLFLKTCCDFLSKVGEKELPRGLNGVTSIFRFYSEAATQALNKRMRLDHHLEIIPKAIAGFAQLLSEAGIGYVTKSEAVTYFESVLTSGGQLDKSLLSQLESEGLLTIEPIRLENGYILEYVRFTFERFSDHAIAKQLLNLHLNKDKVKESFYENVVLKALISDPKNYRRAGILEAIAIQLPEQTGVEILDLGTDMPWTVSQAFLGSLLWREQSNFTEHTFKIAKSILSHDEIFDLLISISTEPDNKFNAKYFHSLLMPLTMPDRDASWSVYLAKKGNEGPIETLISWALHNGLESIDDERAELATIMLSWCLSTSNRVVRDKATKGLACILSKRLSLAAKLLKQLVTLNDPYIKERYLAACYGAVLQGLDSSVEELAQSIFELIFSTGNPPVDALLRDHALGIIEFSNWRGVTPKSIDFDLAQPPYKSPWPLEKVSDAQIESYTEFFEKGSFSDAIVSSTINDGDFARYQLDNKLRKWSPAPYGTKSLPTLSSIYKLWRKKFKGYASIDQSKIFNEYLKAAKSVRNINRYDKTPETENLDVIEASLKLAIGSDNWEDFRVEAKDFIRYRQYREQQPAAFNIKWGRRWVCMRAHDLGWNVEQFKDFERNYINYNRTSHKVERVGKKYQWIAMRELLARMADNLAYIKDSWEHDTIQVNHVSARQLGLRDIDPSLLTTGTFYDGWKQWGKTWWVPFKPVFRPMIPQDRREWLESDKDIINDTSLIELHNPKTNRKWLALSNFSDWKGWGFLDGKKELQRDTWFRLSCLVVRRSDQAALVKNIQNKIFTDSSSLPQIEFSGREFYLGEYFWHPDLKNIDEWDSISLGSRRSAPVRQTVAKYSCESGGYDYSVDRTISIEIPAPWLVNGMGLRLYSGRSPIFVDKSDKEIFYDPSVLEAGPAAALVDREAFLQMLDRENLSAIWIVAGEKSVFGGSDYGFGGRMLHTAIYQLDGDEFSRSFHSHYEKPSKE